MIEFKLKRTALRLDFTFPLVLAVFFWLDREGFGLVALAVCAAHELAHFAVMAACGIIPESVTFYGAGIRITSSETERRPFGTQAAVYSAGCLMNFALATALYILGEYGAAAVSLFTGAFNLLPVGEFDGKRLLRLAVISSVRPERVDAVMFAAGVISAVQCSACLILFSRSFSPTLLITSAYIIIMSLRKS